MLKPKAVYREQKYRYTICELDVPVDVCYVLKSVKIPPLETAPWTYVFLASTNRAPDVMKLVKFLLRQSKLEDVISEFNLTSIHLALPPKCRTWLDFYTNRYWAGRIWPEIYNAGFIDKWNQEIPVITNIEIPPELSDRP